ncbi:MAG: type III-B CRISPR module-associated protein Cmr3 [Thiothrix sp.]|uniref:type III-B CRISPR module-associated protein Cmr3 n=1 Tax=Thiothrix sp. TaxID=1032 RepID=UPI002617A14E|nr:type III-B CRISPR module-associated protein Cmr3 [Thiothrix sp.]MDD5392735.1 type III-B CRISPR module-associated protein Cmr3 [Thiothrix sp.]
MSKKTLVFNATDTLFFRESRPMESMGELQSVFPPPVRTLAGAIRTLIGEQMQVNWREFDVNHPAVAHIGFGDDLGKLHFQGVWLALDGQRLYPAPLLLMQKDQIFYRLTLDTKGIWCDLGKQVRLPKLPNDNAKGSKPLENTWLTADGLIAVLNGDKPDAKHVKTAKDLFGRESRVGIARDNTSRTVEKGLLYQTQHIRPHQGLSVELDASGLPNDMPPKAMIRLGGEGRTACIEVKSSPDAFPSARILSNKPQGLLLYLLTPLSIQPAGKEWQPLPGFTREERDNQTVWTGTLNGIELELHGAVTGKALREGGWDMAKHQPRAVTSLIPAGSVFFCTAKNGDTQAAIQALNNTQIGELSAYGYGHLAAGLWSKD